MRCIVCDATDKWENIDHLKLKKVGMSMCKGCGFVSYPDKYKTEDEIKAYYRDSYRPAPQVGNLFTGERKLQYHSFFLTPLFEEWKSKKFIKPVIGEIGAAYGMFLNWIKEIWPEADINGTELTESYRKVAKHEFDLNLKEEFDVTKKYDLIISYHVLEHQLDADIRLSEYASCLKDDGLFYLSVPIWFRDACNSATGGFDIDYYWVPDHINSWSEEHLEFIIAKAGLEIVLKDTKVYGNTYLLKKTSSNVMQPKFDYKKYKSIAEKIFKCWELIQENKTAEAISTYSNCPAAWINHYELNRAGFHKSRVDFDKFIKDVVDSCPNSADARMFVGDILSRYERYEESHDMLLEALKYKPNNPTIIMGIANTFRMRGKKEIDPIKKEEFYRKSVNLLRFVMSTSTEMLPQAITWSYQDQACLPL